MYDMGQVMTNFRVMGGEVSRILEKEYNDKRIKGTEYADVFNKLMSQALNLAFESPLKEKQSEMIDNQAKLYGAQAADQAYVTMKIRPREEEKLRCEIDLCEKQIEMADKEVELKERELQLKEKMIEKLDYDIQAVEAQIRFTDRQIQGFDENLEQKLLEIQMNAWAMMFSSGLLEEKPAIINNDEVSQLYYRILPQMVQEEENEGE